MYSWDVWCFAADILILGVGNYDEVPKLNKNVIKHFLAHKINFEVLSTVFLSFLTHTIINSVDNGCICSEGRNFTNAGFLLREQSMSYLLVLNYILDISTKGRHWCSCR